MELLKKEYKNILIIFILFLINVFLYKYKTFNIYTDFGREAFFSDIVANGAVLYRDIFNTFIFPFSYMFNAILIKLFGSGLNLFYISGVINTLAILTGLYLLCRQFLNKNISLAITLFIMFYCCFYAGLMNYITPYSYGIVYGLCAAIFSLLCYIRYLNSEKNIFICLSFGLCGLAVSNKYEFVFYALILFLFFISSKPGMKTIVFSIISFGIIPLICLLVLLSQGLGIEDFQRYFVILTNFIHQPYLKRVYETSFYFEIHSFITSLKNLLFISLIFGCSYTSFKLKNKALNILFCIFIVILFLFSIFSVKFLEFSVYEAFSYLPILVLVLTLIKYKKLVKDKSAFVLVCSALIISVKCFWYLANNFYGRYFMPLLLPACCVLLFRFFIKDSQKIYFEKSLILLLILLGFSAFRLNLVSLLLNNTEIKTLKGVVLLKKDEAFIYNKIINFVETNTRSDDKIVVLGAAPLINFLTDRNSVNFYNHFDEAIVGAYTQDRIINAFRKQTADYFIIFGKTNNNYDFCSSYGESICKFVVENYEKVLFVRNKDTADFAIIYKKI